MNVIKHKSVSSQAIEAYLGKEVLGQLVTAMAGGGQYNAPQWYGPPIGVARVPGSVFIGRDGDFVGTLKTNGEMSLAERISEGNKKFLKRLRRATAGELNAFANLSALIAAMTGGKAQRLYYQKVGTTGVVAATNTLWYVGNQPAAGAAAGAAPGGTNPTSASTGALPFANPVNANTLHFITSYHQSSVAAVECVEKAIVEKPVETGATEAIANLARSFAEQMKHQTSSLVLAIDKLRTQIAESAVKLDGLSIRVTGRDSTGRISAVALTHQEQA